MRKSIDEQVDAILVERGSVWAVDYGQYEITDPGNTAVVLLMKVSGEYEPRKWVTVNLDEDDVIDVHA